LTSFRRLSLQGEAYFEVVKNPDKPFLISTSTATTTVIGTKFNLKSRNDETILSVTEGIVQFLQKSRRQTFILTKEEQITTADSIKSSTKQQSFTWSKNYISFKSASLIDALHELQNYYRFDFKLKPKIQKRHLSANFKLDNTIDQLLHTIANALDLNVQKEDSVYLFDLRKN